MTLKRREPPNRYLPDVFHGVWLRLVPAHSKALIEIERAPDVAGVPGAWTPIAVVGPFARQGAYYVDARPSDNALIWYRCRHAAAPLWGSPSAYLQTATAVRARTLSWADLVAQSEASSPYEVGPVLEVTPVPGSTNYTINYTIDADVELFQYNTDGAGWVSVPASGFTVTRPSAGSNSKALTFRALKNGQEATDTIHVLAVDKDTVTPDLTIPPGSHSDSATQFTVSAANPGGGTTPTVKVKGINCSIDIHSDGGNGAIAGVYTSGVEVTLVGIVGAVIDALRPADESIQATFRALAEIAGAGKEEITRTVPPKPNTNQGTIDATTNGSDVIMNAAGPATANSLRYAVSSSSMPSDGSVDSGTVVSGRVSRTSFSGVVPNLGDRYFIKARFYTGASGDGLGGPYITAEVERQNKSATKTIRIPHTAFVPITPATDPIAYALGYVTLNVKPFGQSLMAWVPLPQGATVTGIRMRGTRVNGNGSLSIELLEVTGDGTTTSRNGPNSHSTSGYQTVSGSLTQAVGASSFIVVVIIDNNAATNVDDNRLAYADVDYTVPNLNTGL